MPVPGAAFRVSVLLPLPGARTLKRERLAVNPFGRGPMDKATAESNPPIAVVVTVIDVVAPCFKLTFVLLSIIDRLGVATVRASG